MILKWFVGVWNWNIVLISLYSTFIIMNKTFVEKLLTPRGLNAAAYIESNLKSKPGIMFMTHEF